VLPGFGLSAGITLSYLGLLVMLPLGVLVWRGSALSGKQLLDVLSGPRARAAFELSFGASALAALLNVVFGLLVAWVLTRYRFFGRRFVDALVDLPFALPTAVAGIALTAVYSERGPVGSWLARVGIHSAYSSLGVTIALVFVGLPFVVRTVEPVIRELDPRLEEAAAVLGAGRVRTFALVILPKLAPALVTGFSLAFARALGEYGSVVFISGNIPGKTEIVPLLIVGKLEQFDYPGATAIAVVMLFASFVILLALNALSAQLSHGQPR
jgi:sulfate transport system permease protein